MAPDRTFARHLVMSFILAMMVGCSAPGSKKPEAVPANPEKALEYVLEGREAYDQGRNMAALDAWEMAVKLNPKDAVTVNNLALLLKDENRFEDAISLLETGLQYSPGVADLHYNLAVISELYLLDLERALTHYRKYQALTDADDKRVAGWIADLKRRLD